MDDKDRKFEIDLAQIGMRYGAFFGLGAAIFAIGGTLLLTIGSEIVPDQILVGFIFLGFGILITTRASFWKAKQISKLKHDYMTEPENVPKTTFLYKDYLISLIRCKRYDGTERLSKK